MLKILIGIPSIRPQEYFLESLASFLLSLNEVGVVKVSWVFGKKLVDAQNELAKEVLTGNYSHLLFLEDDHSGHSIEMLKALISADVSIIGIPYYSRHFPNLRLPLLKKKDLFTGSPYKSGIHLVDLLPFGMTLINRSVFERLDFPFFEEDPISLSTDSLFSKRLKALNIPLFGHFDYELEHRGISSNTILSVRKDQEKLGIRKLVKDAKHRMLKAV